ncbi:MAG: PKD domain-containing protein, partial [Bacteroidota bacterium]
MNLFFPKKVFLFFLFVFITFIKLNAQCTASFDADTIVCIGERDSFINTSIGSIDSSIWIWSPGVQSVTIGTRGISHVFASAGTYNVMLIVRGDSSCYDSFTLRITVRINPTAPAFTVSPSSSVCAGTPISFSVTSPVVGQTYSWRFGDGSGSSSTSTTHTYVGYGSSAVTYFDTLTTTLSGCSTTTTSSVSVLRKPDAILGAGSGVFTTVYEGLSTFYKCAVSGSMSTRFSFTNLSTITSGVTSTISWGDGSADTTITAPFSSISHTYARGYYFLTFITRNALGCSDTALYRVFYGSNPSGGILGPGSTDICGPYSLTFYISRFSTNTPGTMYTITFNDGSAPLVFSHPPPDSITHLFTRSSCGTNSSDGSYTYYNAFSANIVIRNPCGVTSGSVVPISVSLPPVANFSIAPTDTICLGTTLLVNNTSVPGSMSSPVSCDTSVAILWSILPSTGWSVSSGSLGSDDGFPGDPTSWISGSTNINFNFSIAGSYQIKMVIGNSCGSDTITKYICVVAPPNAAFTLPFRSGCSPLRVPVTNTSVLVPSCSVIRYNWLVTKIRSTCSTDSISDYTYYSGTSSTSFAPSIQFNNEGTYTIRLQAINVCGTILSRIDTIIVKRKPEATIIVPDSICFGQTITPTILGLKSCGDSITSYSWFFSGGVPASSSLATPGSVSFSTTGPKIITLTIVNSCGTLTKTKTIYVIAPPIANAGRDSFFCSGGSYQLGVPAVAGYTYSWSPTTGLSSASISNPIVSLTNTDTISRNYTYVLTVSNSLRCVSYDTVVITVNPIPRIVVSPSPAVICAGLSVTLTASGANTYTWSPSTGLSASTGAVVTANPMTTTVYTIIGRITSTGCIGSTIDSVIVNPIPIVTPAATQIICSGTSSSSIIHSSSIAGSSYTWTSVSTGVTGAGVSGTGTIPAYVLTNTGSIRGSVIFTVRATANGCLSLPIYDTIYVNPTPMASIALPNQALCSGDTTALVRFTSSVIG